MVVEKYFGGVNLYFGCLLFFVGNRSVCFFESILAGISTANACLFTIHSLPGSPDRAPERAFHFSDT